MTTYRPRRAGVTRWLEGAPAYVLDCFDTKGDADRYTVLFVPEERQEPRDAHVSYLGMNDVPTHPSHGVSMFGELKAHECAAYRYRSGKHRVRWLDLPEHIRTHVVARMAEAES